jgi:hypothetical protein
MHTFPELILGDRSSDRAFLLLKEKIFAFDVPRNIIRKIFAYSQRLPFILQPIEEALLKAPFLWGLMASHFSCFTARLPPVGAGAVCSNTHIHSRNARLLKEACPVSEV